MKDVQRIPTRLNLLEARIVLIIVEFGPSYARGVPGAICQIIVRMVYERAIVLSIRYRHSTSLRKQIPVELAHPLQILFFLLRVKPTGCARNVKNGLALN